MLRKILNSLFYYIYVVLIFFREIRPTRHYVDEHEHEVPWPEVIAVILTTKCPRKNGDAYEIETERYYILFTIRNAVLHVINAKRR